MKKIINGKVYDTSTAHAVGSWDNGIYGDLNSLSESLYRKRTGEFFLFGQGGARTRYASAAEDNRWSSGSSIIPLTWESARQWAEEHLDGDAYEDIFGPVPDDTSRTIVTLSLSAGSVDRARRAAAQAGMSLSAYIESLL